jgi:hypothetical protein
MVGKRIVLSAGTGITLLFVALALLASGTAWTQSEQGQAHVSGPMRDNSVVSITSPSPGATVSYSPVTVSASIGRTLVGQALAGVQFKFDGVNIGPEDNTAPFSVDWDMLTAAPGPHTLTAVARFEKRGGLGRAPGFVFTSDPVEITVVPCAKPLASLPGSTSFNNTVRGQMWVTDNTWWGALSSGSSGIHFYTRSGDSFVQGDLIDTASSGRPETLWNGSELFIAVFRSGSLATFYKYSYSPISGSFVLFPGFPLNLPLAGLANAISLAQDSTGKLWATYTSGTTVRVIWSISADHLIWDTTGFILEDSVSTRTAEAAAIVHFGGDKIGVAWSNQAVDEYGFRFRLDSDLETSWSAKEVVDCCDPAAPIADDHLSLRAAPDGRLVMVGKDNLSGLLGPGRLNFYIRSATGTWGPRIPVDSDPLSQPTRPALALDAENNHAYVLYHNSTTGQVFAARTSLDNPAFVRCVLLAAGNNVTTTKQGVNGTSDLIAVASEDGEIYPGLIDLAPATPSVPVTVAVASQAEAMSAVASTAALVPAAPEETAATDYEVIRNDRLSSSRAPSSDSEWRWLRGKGINTIVHLDGAMVDFAQFGFDSFFWVPLPAGEPPTDEDAERFLRFIQQKENQPAHLSGAAVDGRAVLVALARYAIDGWSIEAALAEGRSVNGGLELSLSTSQVEWLLRWAANHSSRSHRLDGDR